MRCVPFFSGVLAQRPISMKKKEKVYKTALNSPLIQRLNALALSDGQKSALLALQLSSERNQLLDANFIRDKSLIISSAENDVLR